MKVILLKDVPGTGRAHDVKEVAPGFAGNFLIPNKLCVVATPGALKAAEDNKARTEGERKVAKDIALKNLEKIKDARITISGKANEEGHLFAGISAKEVSAAIKKTLNVVVPEEALSLEKPIKTVGETPLTVSMHDESVPFTLVVEKE